MIVITGMHRSGTSAVANILYELGLDFGDSSNLLAADKWNEKGYYENQEVFFLNDYIILGNFAPTERYWTTPIKDRKLSLRMLMTLTRMRYLPMLMVKNVGRKWIAKRSDIKKDEIVKLAEKYNNYVVKDPRFSLTIGDWLKYVTIDKILYCYRHPYEVVMSLKKRDSVPRWLGYRLWHFHVAEYFKQAEGAKMVIVDYNNFFIEGKKFEEVKRLYNFMEKPYVEGESKRLLNSVLDDELKHYTYKNETMPRFVREQYSAIIKYHNMYADLRCYQNVNEDDIVGSRDYSR